MKAITVHQPYAHLIIEDEKRVINLDYRSKYRGPVAIHAGRTQRKMKMHPNGKWDLLYGIPLEDMKFGAIIAYVDVVDCVTFTGKSKHTGLNLFSDFLRVS